MNTKRFKITELWHCEIHAVRASFMALYEAEGGSVKIKQKKVCNCDK